MHPNQNDPEFQFQQGHIAYRYFGDLTTAKRRLTYAAKRGHRDTRHLLGTMFEEEKAFKSAAKWYRLAAWQGRLPAAAYSLGRLYLYGFGVRHSVKEATRWLRQAALGADTNAMSLLATLVSKPEAYAWFRLAALRKSSEAAVALQELVPSMTAGEVKQGKRLVPELGKRIKRPAARKPRVAESAKVYVGCQHIEGGMTEWRVDFWIQRSGIDWILHMKGEEGGIERIGPLEALALVEEMNDRGLDVEEFVPQLRSSKLPMLTKLAKEIEEAQRCSASTPAPSALKGTHPSPLRESESLIPAGRSWIFDDES